MDVQSPEHESATSDAMEVKVVEHDSAFSNDDGSAAGRGSSACWAKEVEETRSDLTCNKTLLIMCRSYGIRVEDYRPLCAERGPTSPPAEASNAVCVFEAMLHAGVRFPLHSFYSKVLTHVGLAPGQLTPNSWRILAGFVLLCEGAGVRPMVAVFRHYFKLCANGCSRRGFFRFDPCNHDRRLFKINGRLPVNDGWKKRFFFLDSNQPWGCPKDWGMPTAEAYAKLEISEVARTVISKLEAERAKTDIHLLELLNKSLYENSFPILPSLPTPTQVKAEDNHDHDEAAATAIESAHPHPPKRMCLSLDAGPITRHQKPPSPPGRSSNAGGDGDGNDDDDDEDGELSMSQKVYKMVQDSEEKLRLAKQQLRVEKAERAVEVSRLQNDVTQLMEKLETAKAEHTKEVKALYASQAQLRSRIEKLIWAHEVAESEYSLKVHNLIKDLKAEKDKHMYMDLQFKEDLKATQGERDKALVQLKEMGAELMVRRAAQAAHTARVRQLEAEHATKIHRLKTDLQAAQAKGVKQLKEMTAELTKVRHEAQEEQTKHTDRVCQLRNDFEAAEAEHATKLTHLVEELKEAEANLQKLTQELQVEKAKHGAELNAIRAQCYSQFKAKAAAIKYINELMPEPPPVMGVAGSKVSDNNLQEESAGVAGSKVFDSKLLEEPAAIEQVELMGGKKTHACETDPLHSLLHFERPINENTMDAIRVLIEASTKPANKTKNAVIKTAAASEAVEELMAA